MSTCPSGPGKAFNGIEVSIPHELDVEGFDPFRPVSVQPHDLRANVERRVVVSLVGDIAALHLCPTPETGYDGESVDEEIARQALAKLAPRLAELVVARELSTEPLSSDEDGATDLARAFAGPEAGWLYLGWLRCEALELVMRYRTAIWRVADALECVHVLTGEQVSALVFPPQRHVGSTEPVLEAPSLGLKVGQGNEQPI